MSEVVFTLRGDFIPLDALLKGCGLASSGGDAKRMVVAGMVSVNGSVEPRRTCKIRPGQRIECAGTTVIVMAGPRQPDQNDAGATQ